MSQANTDWPDIDDDNIGMVADIHLISGQLVLICMLLLSFLVIMSPITFPLWCIEHLCPHTKDARSYYSRW